MITIRPVYNEFKITFSNPGSGWRGYSVMARNVNEIHKTIDHYHRTNNHGILDTDCPLCRMEMEEARKKAAKGRRK